MNQAPGSTDTIYLLMNFRFDLVQYGNMGEKIITQETENRIDKSLKKIHTIIKRHQEISYSPPLDVGEIYRLFMRFAPRGYEDLIKIFDSSRKIRKLAYSLGYKNEKENLPPIILSNYLNLALRIIETKWKYSMFDGLFDVLLKFWIKLQNTNGDLLRKLIDEKLNQCPEKIVKIYKIKKNKWSVFFNQKDGPEIIAVNKGLQPGQMCSLLKSYPFSERMRGYEYLSEVVVAFTNRCLDESPKQEIIVDILNFLKIHGDIDSNKRCLCKMIIAANEKFIELQDVVKTSSLQLIGDPANSAYWQSWERATNDDIEEIKKAQQILNEWLTKQFIDIFFSKISIDLDRKQFWMKYAKYVTTFKIFGSDLHRRTLSYDERIRDYVPSRFGILRGN